MNALETKNHENTRKSSKNWLFLDRQKPKSLQLDGMQINAMACNPVVAIIKQCRLRNSIIKKTKSLGGPKPIFGNFPAWNDLESQRHELFTARFG